MERVFNEKRLSNRDNLILTCFSIYCFVGILLLSVLTNNSNLEKLVKVLQLVSLAVIGVCLLQDVFKKRLKIDLTMVVLGVLSLISLWFSRQTHILVFVVLIYALRNVELKNIVAVGSRVMMLALFVIVSSACLKLIPNSLAFREGSVRYSLGFAHPTFPQYLMMMVAIANCYLFGTNISYSALGLEVLAAFCLNRLTNSRAGFAIVLIIVFVTIVCKLLKKYKFVIDRVLSFKPVKIILILAPILVYAFSVLCVFLYSRNVGVIEKLDLWLSTRISLAYQAFLNNDLTLFGRELIWHSGTSYFGLDNAYFYLLFNRGLVILELFIVLYMYMIYKSIKLKDWWLLFLILVVLIDSLIDPILDDYKYNFFIFMVGGLIIKKKELAINCD